MLDSFEPGQPIVDDLRRIILSVPTNRTPLLVDAAHALAMSPRTLERRLHEEGLNFRQPREPEDRPKWQRAIDATSVRQVLTIACANVVMVDRLPH